jgi:hypothetical protein
MAWSHAATLSTLMAQRIGAPAPAARSQARTASLAELTLCGDGRWRARLSAAALASVSRLPPSWSPLAHGTGAERTLASRAAAVNAVNAVLAGGGSDAARKARERKAHRQVGQRRFEAWVTAAEHRKLSALLAELREPGVPTRRRKTDATVRPRLRTRRD